MKQNADWLTTTIFAEDALESRNARDYFSEATRFIIMLPSIYPVSDKTGLEYLQNCYVDMTQAADSFNVALQHYAKYVSADYVPAIPAANCADYEKVKISHSDLIRTFEKDFDVVCKCNKHFGRNRIILTKTATDAKEWAKTFQYYEEFIAATHPLAKYLGNWLNNNGG